MNLTLRHASHATDAAAILDLLRGLHAEIDAAPINGRKAFAAIEEVAMTGAAWMVFDGDELVGSLGLTEFEQWFGDESFIGNLWFYVKPLYRAGEAGAMLLAEAKALALGVGKRVLLDLPLRRRAGHSSYRAIAERVGFDPDRTIVAVGRGTSDVL